MTKATNAKVKTTKATRGKSKTVKVAAKKPPARRKMATVPKKPQPKPVKQPVKPAKQPVKPANVKPAKQPVKPAKPAKPQPKPVKTPVNKPVKAHKKGAYTLHMGEQLPWLHEKAKARGMLTSIFIKRAIDYYLDNESRSLVLVGDKKTGEAA